MDNRYLKDRAKRRMRRRRDSMDSARRRGRNYDRYDYPEHMSMDNARTYARPMDSTYDRYHEHHGQLMYPTSYEVGHYIYDSRDYDDMNEYHKDLEEWIHKLKRHDRFNVTKEDAIRKAKEMNVKFDMFDETEFYATYLMMVSDFKHVANDPHMYLAMAKEWLEDADIIRRGSEKVCAYLYTIVLGEDDD